MAVDGSITIGAILTTDKFDRQIAKFEKDMQDTEDKLELKLNAKIQAENELKKHKQDIFDLEQEYEKLAPKVERYNELISQSKAGTNLSPKDFQFISEIQNSNVLSQYDKMGSQLDGMYAKEERLNAKVQQKAYAYKQVADKVAEYKQKIESVNLQKQVADANKLKAGFKNVGSSIQGAVKHVARLALGIFGLRSAYMALRRASSNLATYDKQYAANIEYIRYALTQAIAPVLRWIVRLAATLLGYINTILNGWFGINLFSRGSAENFNKMKASTGGISKAVKEIKKQLAGFDEINMLTDQSDTGTKAGGGGSGIATPDFDLSAMQGEVPDWLQWIIDNRDLILSIIAGIAAGLLAWKLGLDGIKALGIGILVKGIIDLISSLRDYLKDPSWENFGKVVKAIGEIILGVGLLIWDVPLIVAGAITIILGLLAKNWDKIREGFNKAIDWIKGLGDKAWQWFFSNIDTIKEKFGWLGLGIVSTFIMAFDWITKLVAGIVEVIRNLLDGLFKGAKQILDGIIQIFRGNFKSGIISILKGIANLIIGVLNGLISGINAIIYPVRAIIAALGSVMGKSWTVNSVQIPKIPYLKTGGIVNMPNRGTMIGGAIAGESGREGVLPLTDQQAMAQLGAEIGRHVLINLTNITQMNGRVIGRELKQVQSEQEFAFNS